VDPNQGTLVAMPRDWRRIDTQALPALTPAAERLLEAFKQRSRAQAWDDGIRGEATRALHLLLAWLGAAAPIPEADIRSIPTARRWTSSRRVLRFLEEHDLVVPDPARQVDVDQHAVEQRLQTLPDGIAGELRRWVQVLRGQGRRQHRPMGFSTIRKYVGYADPVVPAWATRVSSLREITPDDIRAVLRERQGNQARSVHVSLRSLFQALQQEQLVFGDPTRGIALIKVERLPAPLPSDRLRGLLDQADGAMARLAVGLLPSMHSATSSSSSCACTTSISPAAGSRSTAAPAATPSTWTGSPTASRSPGSGNASGAGHTPATPTCWSASRPPSTPATRPSPWR
jgi:hypothetical protein